MEIVKLLESTDVPGTRVPCVAVIGDLMLDEHVSCEVVGFSPEDDLAPKLRVVDRQFQAGGAANVAMNLRKMGANVWLGGHMEHDNAGLMLSELLQKSKINLITVASDDRPTTTKTRYITPHGRHAIRIDCEKTSYLNEESLMSMLRVFHAHSTETPFDIIVVSDYAKGVVQSFLMDELRTFDRPILVDPKSNSFSYYGKVTYLTPNEKEARNVSNRGDDPNFEEMVDAIDHQADGLVVTLSEHGCVLCNGLRGKPGSKKYYRARAREIGDPTGCGDSFMAGLAYGLAYGWDYDNAIRIAVAAGSVAFDHKGVHYVTKAEIIKELEGGTDAS